MNGSHLLRVSPAAPGTEARRELWMVKSFISKSLASQIDIWFWQTICSNSWRSKNLLEYLLFCFPIFNGFDLREFNFWGDIYKTLELLIRLFLLSPEVKVLVIPLAFIIWKWQVSDRLFRYCEKIELTRKAGLEVWASPPPSLSESGSRPFQCGKTYKSLDLD